MAVSVIKRKQDYSDAPAFKIAEVAVGCVEKHGLMKPISLASVKKILSSAKLIDVNYHRETIGVALRNAVCKGKIHEVARNIFWVNLSLHI